MQKLFYRPVDAWVGDNMPLYHDGKFYLYYQSDKRIPVPFPKGEPFGWSLAVSKDLVSFEDYGEVLKKGEKGGREHCLFAGSVINDGDIFYAFYTGEYRPWTGHDDMPPSEAFMIATSKNGIEWDKHPDLTMYAPDGFDNDFFRDPCVYKMDDGSYLLLICTRRKNGPKVRRGVLLAYKGVDLLHWKYQGVFFNPEMYFLLQMPDLFKIGDWYYLLFSELDDKRRTRYRMSRSLNGPWIAPSDDSFDGRCYYAARTIVAEGKRYMFGWNPTRENDDDKGMWIWGGNSITHEIIQRSDGTLAVVFPDIIAKRFIPSKTLKMKESITLRRIDGEDDEVLIYSTQDFFKLDFDFKCSSDTYGFGIKIYESSEKDLGYAYHFIPGENRFIFDKSPNYPWFLCMNRGLDRPLDNMAETHHASLIVDDDIAVLYIDGIALNARMAEKPGREIKFYVQNGELEVSNIKYCEVLK